RIERRARRVRERGGHALQRAQQPADGRERLTDVVVQLARDPLPLRLERLQEALREVLARELALPAGADVAHHAEDVLLAADLEQRGAHLDREERAVLAA